MVLYCFINGVSAISFFSANVFFFSTKLLNLYKTEILFYVLYLLKNLKNSKSLLCKKFYCTPNR